LDDNGILAWCDADTEEIYAVTVRSRREILRAEFPHWTDDQIDLNILMRSPLVE
jgi:hypothetical protein